MARETLTIFFATDIHGSGKCFRKFVNAATFFQADVLIMGGDITGKMVVPIVEEPDGTYVARFSGTSHVVTRERLEELEQTISSMGYYPYRTSHEEVQWLQNHPEAVEELFHLLIVKTLEEWLQLARERLARKNVQLYISPGNDDAPFVDELLRSDPFVKDPDCEVVWIRDWLPMLSCGIANTTPFNSPRELPEPQLYEQLSRLAHRIPDPGQALFNLHVPPRDTPLDQAPLLKKDLSPVVRGGEIVFGSVGSTAVRRVIETYQPLVSLHGHVHESRATCRIGKTTCLNPGSEYGEGVLRGVLLRLSPGKLLGHQFISG
jgi:Icc-related predicted phosphoesterase